MLLPFCIKSISQVNLACVTRSPAIMITCDPRLFSGTGRRLLASLGRYVWLVWTGQWWRYARVFGTTILELYCLIEWIDIEILYVALSAMRYSSWSRSPVTWPDKSCVVYIDFTWSRSSVVVDYNKPSSVKCYVCLLYVDLSTMNYNTWDRSLDTWPDKPSVMCAYVV